MKVAVNEVAQSPLFFTHNQQVEKVSKLSHEGGGIRYFLAIILYTSITLRPDVIADPLEPFPT